MKTAKEQLVDLINIIPELELETKTNIYKSYLQNSVSLAFRNKSILVRSTRYGIAEQKKMRDLKEEVGIGYVQNDTKKMFESILDEFAGILRSSIMEFTEKHGVPMRPEITDNKEENQLHTEDKQR